MKLPTTDHSKSPVSGSPSSLSRWSLGADEVGGWATETCRQMNVQVAGNFSGAKVFIEGTNDPKVKAVRLAQQFDDDLSFDKPALSGVRDIPKFIRPVVVGGDAKTDITVLINMVL